MGVTLLRWWNPTPTLTPTLTLTLTLKANTAAVVERPEFATLPPRSLVKWNMWAAGVVPTDSRKRPRGAD